MGHWITWFASQTEMCPELEAQDKFSRLCGQGWYFLKNVSIVDNKKPKFISVFYLFIYFYLLE